MTNPILLNKFWNELSGKENSSTQQDWYDSLANTLMNELCLIIGKSSYRITECEFYYSDIDHTDPHVHGGEEQMTAGKFYLNKVGGLDITFGNPASPAWGGILIRGMRNLKTNQYISKVTKIVEEVFAALGNVILEKNGIYFSELTAEGIDIEQPIKTTRIGLKRDESDEENFIDKPYRYIVELVPAHKFAGKEQVVKQLLSENKISTEQAKNILSYDLRQQ